MSTAGTQSDGTGTYFCSYQGSGHLKLVQFQLTVSPTGTLRAKALDAGYVASGDHGVSASERLFSSSTKVSLATSANTAAYGIASLLYYTTEALPPPPPPSPPALPAVPSYTYQVSGMSCGAGGSCTR